MRLLQWINSTRFNLTDNLVGEAISRYVILSHTWGLDADEVTFEDLKNGTGRDKHGYKKIWFCGEQARRNRLRYFWVDTYCIDKSSSAELSEAINSIFFWYQQSAICYAYLADVQYASPLSDESDVATSRWFSRGWTLQELLAPTEITFFTSE